MPYNRRNNKTALANCVAKLRSDDVFKIKLKIIVFLLGL